MTASFKDGMPDWKDGLIVAYIGKKRSGKSVMAKYHFSLYPGDRVVIDIAGDDGPQGGDIIELRGSIDELPARWPESMREDGKRMTLRYVPDAKSPTLAEDIDAVIAMADEHSRRQRNRNKRGVCILVHEIGGQFAKASGASRHFRKALMQNRHSGLTLLLCGPRPQTIDPLVIQQSDVIYVFELMNPNDRRRLAETIGWNPDDFDAFIDELGPHEHLRFDANETKPAEGADDERLVHCDALPLSAVKGLQ